MTLSQHLSVYVSEVCVVLGTAFGQCRCYSSDYICKIALSQSHSLVPAGYILLKITRVLVHWPTHHPNSLCLSISAERCPVS